MEAFKENPLNICHSEACIPCPFFMDVHINTYGNSYTKVSQQHTQWLHIAGDEHLICHI